MYIYIKQSERNKVRKRQENNKKVEMKENRYLCKCYKRIS